MANMVKKIHKYITKMSDYLRTNKVIVLYGCTAYAPKICMELQQHNIRLSAIIDNDVNKIGKRCWGVNVYKPQEYLLPYNPNIVVIVCSVHECEMIKSLEQLGYRSKNIICISEQDAGNPKDSIESFDEGMKLVKKGYELYNEILSEYCEDTKILIAPKASGDIFIACSFLRAWCEKNNIKDYVLIGTGRNLLDVSELYEIDNVKLISEEDKSNLLCAYMFLGNKMNVKLFSEWEMRIRNSYFSNDKDAVCFKDKFKYESFNLKENVKPETPCFTKDVDYSKYGLKKNRTIIMAPYAYSSPAAVIPSCVLEKLADKLILKGFKVFTVSYGNREPVIRNTECIQFPYKDSVGLLEYAGGFIGSRSGLCDITSSAKCKKVIVYGSGKYSKDFFSLSRNFEGFVGEEVVYDDYSEDEFIEYVIKYFAEG